ncbi:MULTISPECIES: hypothetical protein [Spirulina sp. CCY15215]|uniref:hypothetical protein n=1 Tax=Spirulina sp. CCY15215 TaxID=2767591 RepID=UPI001950797D|nr:hypothetical protein [Spirulina major]
MNFTDVTLAYYHDNFDEIRRQIQESEHFVREMQAKISSKVQQKLRKGNLGKN